MSVKYFKHINDFLDTLDVPQIIHDDFYIVKFENHNFHVNQPQAAYSHDYFEIFLSVGYNTMVSTEDKEANTLEYNISFVSPGQLVKWETNKIPMKDTISYMILFKPAFLPFVNGKFSLFETFPYFNNYTQPSYKLTQLQKLQFKRCFQDLHDEYKLGEMAARDILKSYLTVLLFKAKRELKCNTEVSYLKTRKEEITYDFENLVKRTNQKHHPIKYYADLLNISSIYLSECVKSVTDKTAKQIIDEYLILEAKSLLKLSNYTIYEIAHRLGFDDDSNFVKYFRKQTKLTPKQFKIYE